MSVLLVAHGSRDPRFARTVTGICGAVGAAVPDERVELGYLDLSRPLVGHALEARWARDDTVTVVPLLLGDGYHSRFDLPVLLDAARQRRPDADLVQTPVLGSISLVDALADRLSETGLRAGDGVLMYAVGSSDERADDAARRRGAELSRQIGHQVEVVFATKLGPGARVLRSALDRLHAAGARRIVGLPYFLSPGLLTERVDALLGEAGAGPVAAALGSHPRVVDAIVALTRAPSPASSETGIAEGAMTAERALA